MNKSTARKSILLYLIVGWLFILCMSEVYILFYNGIPKPPGESQSITGVAVSNSSAVLNFNVLPDADDDSVPDYNDTLIGKAEWANWFGLTDFNVTVSGNSTNGSFDGPQDIIFYDAGRLLVNVTHNFSLEHRILLNQIDVIITNTSLVVNFRNQLPPGENKILYFNSTDFDELCVDDSEISSANDISDACTEAGETDFDTCLGNAAGVTKDDITCVNEIDRIKVSNLKHSGVKGTFAAPAEAPPPAEVVPIPPSRGGRSECKPKWQCTEWGMCQQDNFQRRTCTDLNRCFEKGAFFVSEPKPQENQSCTYTCYDGIRNIKETDVDCGGSDCIACPLSGSCNANTDCVSGNCFRGICREAGIDCAFDADCSPGYACANGRCEAKVEIELPAPPKITAVIVAGWIVFLILLIALILQYLRRKARLLKNKRRAAQHK